MEKLSNNQQPLDDGSDAPDPTDIVRGQANKAKHHHSGLFSVSDTDRYLCIKYLQQYGDTKEEAEEFLKTEIELIEEYLSQNTGWSHRTKASYARIILEFMTYSPVLHPDDLSSFLSKKFLI